MTKHTEGPWEAVEHSWAEIGIYGGGKRIAGLSIADEATEETETMLGAQMEANATLMKSAPNLFEALKGAVAAWDRVYSTHPLPLEFEDIEFQEMQRARQALAEVLGE
ncbi:hypothetical protein [Cupriavidus metallidurans]|uniref:hypothetical protein n=1 Tax=Cupriavidus metallidurans TaxID=119219 RepID=UPI001647FEFA|nr:hypothetical protein [Cupriavidus metallidurans]